MLDTVAQAHADLIRRLATLHLNHVVVRHDVAIFRDDHAGADPDALETLFLIWLGSSGSLAAPH